MEDAFEGAFEAIASPKSTFEGGFERVGRRKMPRAATPYEFAPPKNASRGDPVPKRGAEIAAGSDSVQDAAFRNRLRWLTRTNGRR